MEIVGQPVLIIWFYWRPMEKIWYIFLIQIGGENDSKSSGWYNFEEVIPYIAKALYIESY